MEMKKGKNVENETKIFKFISVEERHATRILFDSQPYYAITCANGEHVC